LTSQPNPVLLIAEDNALVRHLVAASLADDIFTIVEATTGGEALQLVHQMSPAVAILDIHMPERSGIEICRAIRERPQTRNCLVIILTGSVHTDDRTAALAAGANTYLTKPFSPVQLRTLVHNALGGSVPSGERSTEDPGHTIDGLATSAFLLAQVERPAGYLPALPDDPVARSINALHQSLQQQQDACDGREVSAAGDSRLLVFPTARQAVQAAVAVAGDLDAGRNPQPAGLSVQFGVDLAPPNDPGIDFVQHALNRLAKVAARAGAGEVVITEAASLSAGPTEGFRYQPLGDPGSPELAPEASLYRVVAGRAKPQPAAPRGGRFRLPFFPWWPR